MNEELENDDAILLKGIQKLTEESQAFEFLKDDEDIYSIEDIKFPPSGGVRPDV